MINVMEIFKELLQKFQKYVYRTQDLVQFTQIPEIPILLNMKNWTEEKIKTLIYLK